MSIAAGTALLERDLVSLPELHLHGKRYSQPAQLELTEDVGLIFGQYLAEGHAAPNFALFSVRDPDVQGALQRCFVRSGVPFYRRQDGDFVVATRVWRDLLHKLMGGKAGVKRMPDFWPALSNKVLSALLRGYFEGDGGLDGGAVTAVTLSRELAADVTEALLRFGIWARMRQTQKRKPNGTMGSYWKITISGAENLAASPPRSASSVRARHWP